MDGFGPTLASKPRFKLGAIESLPRHRLARHVRNEVGVARADHNDIIAGILHDGRRDQHRLVCLRVCAHAAMGALLASFAAHVSHCSVCEHAVVRCQQG